MEYLALNKYLFEKQKRNWTIKAAGAFLAGALIALGCVGFLFVYCHDESGVSLFLGSISITTGFLMCMLLGISSFTSICTESNLLISREIKIRQFLKDIGIVFVFNYIGGGLIALLIWSTGIFEHNTDPLFFHNVQKFCEQKITQEWWDTLLSAILATFLNVLAIIIFATVKNNVVGAIAFTMITIVFADGGFQQIATNIYYTTTALLLNKEQDWNLVWQTFIQSMLPSAIGNIFGGFVICYIFQKFICKK